MNETARSYEGMFLLDAGLGFEAASEPVRTILVRNDAEVLSMQPWDEKKLAYEISGRKRGLYMLTYFKADPSRITEIEHDCQLNEQILRALILHRKHLTDEEIQAATPATSAARRADEAAARAQAAEPSAGEGEKPATESEPEGKSGRETPEPAGEDDAGERTAEDKTDA